MDSNKEKILVVDDDVQIRRALKNALSARGYEVLLASNGDEALEIASLELPSMIILDLSMPGMTGLDVCKELRTWSQSPILVLSVHDKEKDKVSALDLGADDYLTKPFNTGELLARIRALLRGKANKEITKLKVEDLEMDLLNHTVKRGGKEIDLSTKEYMLLEYLMRNAGNVLTRTMILENVWGLDFDTFTNIVDVYINYLRNKIDKDFEKKLLHTIRGRGYTLKG